MAKSPESKTESILDILAEEVGIPRDELDGDAEFIDLGVDDILAKSILSKIAENIGLQLPKTTFIDYATVDKLRSYLQASQKLAIKRASHETPVATSPVSTKANPLSMALQGEMVTAKTTIFLLPDGSGSAAAYLRLPAIDPNVCLIGLNSPFLNASKDAKFSVEGISATWADEIRRRQPNGPYILGGWSAGGYYSFEVAKYLHHQGQTVEKLILIDSPCRLVYEELPMEVVHHLSENNLMGNWGTKKPPSWMINHFAISIRAISEYIPTPMEQADLPDVFIIWAKDGVFNGAGTAVTGLDLNVKVTRMLLQRPESDGPLGWERLVPGAKLFQAKVPGNHFTIVHPPHCKSLSMLLRDVVQDEGLDRKSSWREL